VLVTPRAKVTHSTTYREAIEQKRALVCNPCAPPAHPYSAPRLRWSAPSYHREHGEIIREMMYRLGKTAEAILDALEAAGGTLSLEEIAAILGVARPRDLLRRDGPLSRLQAAAVVECSGHTVSLAAAWTSALEDERERAGEIAAYRRDMARYARESEAYRQRRSLRSELIPQSERSCEDCPHAPHPPPPDLEPDGCIEDLERLSSSPVDPVEVSRALYPLINRSVETPGGPGILIQVFTREARVVLDSTPSRWMPFDPAEIRAVECAA
jgi:hypothetical protein